MNDNDAMIKDPDNWKSGGEPETAAQRSCPTWRLWLRRLVSSRPGR
jgi:hypothetical protein